MHLCVVSFPSVCTILNHVIINNLLGFLTLCSLFFYYFKETHTYYMLCFWFAIKFRSAFILKRNFAQFLYSNSRNEFYIFVFPCMNYSFWTKMWKYKKKEERNIIQPGKSKLCVRKYMANMKRYVRYLSYRLSNSFFFCWIPFIKASKCIENWKRPMRGNSMFRLLNNNKENVLVVKYFEKCV